MRMVHKAAKRVVRAFKRRSYLLAAGFAALAPAGAFAQERIQSAPLSADTAQDMLMSGYFPFSTSAGGDLLQGLMTHTAARDLMIAMMFAVCLAMVFAASYLWRENLNHLKADAERKERNRLDRL